MHTLRSSLTFVTSKLVFARTLPLAAVLLVGAAGCSAGAATTASSPADLTREPIATEEPGPLRAAGLAMGDVPLRADQRTTAKDLFKKAELRHQALRKETATLRKEIMLALADQVQAGTIDKAALAPKAEAAMAAFRKVRSEDLAALGELHKVLTPDQRKAFVDAFEPKMMHKAMEGHPMKERLGKLRELDLTADQKDKLKEAFRAEMGDKHPMKEMRAHRQHAKQALEAFKSDTWTPAQMPDRTAEWLPRALRFAEIATPLLTPEQRTKAAAMLRERAAQEKP